MQRARPGRTAITIQDSSQRSFRTKKQGLAEMNAPEGSIIAYATSPGEVAADGAETMGCTPRICFSTLHS